MSIVISRTPYRISFFGGGSDYKSWYERHGGCVLSTSIDKYCYITTRYLPPFHTEKSRVVWSKIESVAKNSDIEHPSVNACLQALFISQGVEINHTGDLPARSGLGSSSAFTVGLLNALCAMRGDIQRSTRTLAEAAIDIERNFLKENVGIQDQIACAVGGFNKTTISTDGNFIIKNKNFRDLEQYLLLFFTGVSRTASDIAAEQIEAHSTGNIDSQLHEMQKMPEIACEILETGNILDFGELLHKSWMLKRSLAKNISPQFVDDIYNRGKKSGAIGGKLLGAGGGGFMLFFAKPENHEAIKQELKEFIHVPFKFEGSGSQIIFRS